MTEIFLLSKCNGSNKKRKNDERKKLLRLEIRSVYSKKREIKDLECVAHCAKKKNLSAWREVKREFGCITCYTCNCHIGNFRFGLV